VDLVLVNGEAAEDGEFALQYRIGGCGRWTEPSTAHGVAPRAAGAVVAGIGNPGAARWPRRASVDPVPVPDHGRVDLQRWPGPAAPIVMTEGRRKVPAGRLPVWVALELSVPGGRPRSPSGCGLELGMK
jgi:hypothetical protein